MKKALLLIIRILIPVVCIASASAFCLPALDLTISKNDMNEIKAQLAAYDKAQEEEKADYENGGRMDIYYSIENKSVSGIEVLTLHSKTAGDDIAEENTDADIIYNGFKTAINDNYILIFTLMSVSVIFMITTLIFAAVRSNRLLSLLTMVFSLLYLAVNVSVIAVMYMIVAPSFNNCKLLDAQVSPLLYITAAGALLAVVLGVVRMILERTWESEPRPEYNVPPENVETTVTLDHKILANANISGNTSLEATQLIYTVKPSVTCLKGSCEGLEVPIENGDVIFIGRDIESCNIIVSHSKVSRRHCSISYDRKRNQYIVTDLSHNGTFTESGEKLLKDHSNILQNGSVIYLYNRDNMFRLGR